MTDEQPFLMDLLDKQGEDRKSRKFTTAINTKKSEDDFEFKTTTVNRGRQMSLATKPKGNQMKLVENAAKLCKNPIKLSWTDVYYEVEVPATEADRIDDPSIVDFKKTPIVRCVTGFAPPGQTTYIMGSSGAGKTSLLNILTGRTKPKSG